jgi:hypothetical protein
LGFGFGLSLGLTFDNMNSATRVGIIAVRFDKSWSSMSVGDRGSMSVGQSRSSIGQRMSVGDSFGFNRFSLFDFSDNRGSIGDGSSHMVVSSLIRITISVGVRMTVGMSIKESGISFSFGFGFSIALPESSVSAVVSTIVGTTIVSTIIRSAVVSVELSISLGFGIGFGFSFGITFPVSVAVSAIRITVVSTTVSTVVSGVSTVISVPVGFGIRLRLRVRGGIGNSGQEKNAGKLRRYKRIRFCC